MFSCVATSWRYRETTRLRINWRPKAANEERGRGIFGLNGKGVMLDPEGALWQLGEHAPVKVDVSQWNEYVILAQGNRLQHFINGQPTSELIDHHVDKRTLEGLLAIQLHKGNPNRVEINVPPPQSATRGAARALRALETARHRDEDRETAHESATRHGAGGAGEEVSQF